MAERWMLSRAGITNVYQYTDEVLRFGGGRLLLRGVNGSGKSTAMNMLLPFLLDADVRRIDAAGDQAGVLRSWMLAGRDETQPTGYLWIEMVRRDDHLSFGCGIKANRNTGNVTHWWFVADRRPGIDLHLVRHHGSARTPLGVEELRRELGPGHVWTMDQRPAYRAALHGRLYGGADLDQHIRLLHIVRNPRVGDRVDDRIDVGLTAHLHDALPQLSEAAIDDAATPLEQLDEHRRNVSDLSRTVDTLQALLDTYRDHVRSGLRAHADAALEHVARHRTLERAAAAAVAEADRARAEVAEVDASIIRLVADEDRLAGEIDQLRASEAYASASELVERRAAVARMADQAAAAAARARRQVERAEQDGADVQRHEQAAAAEAGHLQDDLLAVAAAAGAATLAVEVPARPEVPVAPLAVGPDVVTVPAAPFAAAPLVAALADIRAAAQGRTGEVARASAALDAVDVALAAVRSAEERLGTAQRHLDRASDEAARTATARAGAGETWRTDARGWLDAVASHAAASGAPFAPPVELAEADVIADHDRLHDALGSAIEVVLGAHRTADAHLAARRTGALAARDEAQEEVDILAAREVPDPPTAAWQGPRVGPALAEVIDFADASDDAQRAGLEAALEASGLLVAEVRSDGSIAAGDLVIRPVERVPAPLSDLVVPSIPAGHPGLTVAAVSRILDGISTDAAALDDHQGGTVVTDSGEFRVGALRGRHTKAAAEHIGVTARRAALERMRAEAADRLAAATRALDGIEDDLALVRQHIAAAEALRSAMPSTRPLVAAIAAADAAEVRRTEAAGDRDQAGEQRDEAERRHGRAVDEARRICATAGLPHDREGLAAIGRACRDVPALADAVHRSARQLAGSVGRWTSAGERWSRSRREADDDTKDAQAAADAHRSAQARLATLEDAIGLDAQELFETLDHAEAELKDARRSLATARDQIGPARQRLGTCQASMARTTDEVEQSSGRAVAVLGRLRAAIAVPGLWAAAVPDVDPGDGHASVPAVPVVPSSVEGVRTLATAVVDVVPVPGQAVTHDGVRTALLRRRSDLGAGWDATAQHPELDLPLAVEVTGPLGQMPLASAATAATDQLATKRGLLTAQQTDALRNLLQGLVAKEVAEKLQAARELVAGMNERLREVRTTHGIGTSLRWKRRDDVSDDVAAMVDLLSRPPDLRTPDDDARLVAALSARIADARASDPEADYRTLIGRVLDYRDWHRMQVVVHRPGQPEAVLSRRTPLSEGEKKIVSYQPLFAAVAASCDSLAERAPDAPRFVLLDDAFAKVSEDNHPKLFGLLVELDLDFIATSERLWGTHATVPELAITEVVRDADAGVIVLEHSHWDGQARTEAP